MKIETLSKVLATHPFLQGLAEEHIEFLTGCASNLRFEAGDFLARCGDPTEHTYLLRSGRVALEVFVPGKGPQRVQTVGENEALGWSWLFPPYEWHFDARALDTTLVLAFDGACLRRKLEEDHHLGYEMLKRLIRAAHQRLERTRLQMLDVYEKGGAGRRGDRP